MSDDVLSFVSLAGELEAFIQQTIPDATTVSKYGGTLFTLKAEEKEGQFCGVFIYKQHVQISFSQGALLDDPKQLLAGSGKLRRHMNFKSMTDVDSADLENLLVQSSQL